MRLLESGELCTCADLSVTSECLPEEPGTADDLGPRPVAAASQHPDVARCLNEVVTGRPAAGR